MTLVSVSGLGAVEWQGEAHDHMITTSGKGAGDF